VGIGNNAREDTEGDMKRIHIEINIKYGSNFQREVAQNTIATMLLAWCKYFNHAHKKNMARYVIDFEAQQEDEFKEKRVA